MAILDMPDDRKTIQNYFEIINFLRDRGIHYEKWILNEELPEDADEPYVLRSYEHRLKPYMEVNGYQTADVVCVHPRSANLEIIRDKFLREHVHSEDEVRFFAKGQGLFWFHLESDEVFSLLCQEGDLISVPAGYRHWFDIGDPPYVKAIRIFTDPEGWVAQYTQSGVEKRYQ